MQRTQSNGKLWRVGVIGAGEVSQVIHLPTLALLSNLYKVVAICDISPAAVEHAQHKYHIPHGFHRVEEMVAHEEIDVVLVASADEYHCQHAILAANAGKHVLIEKPMTLTREDAEKVEQARVRNRVHINVAYMRRYAPAFAVFLEEVRKAGKVQFARVFDYPGANAIFVQQSGVSPMTFTDDVPASAMEEKRQRANEMVRAALGVRKANDKRLVKAFRLLGSLGSHDLSCMRHVFGGVPDRCTTAFISSNAEFIGATFVYDQQPLQSPSEPDAPPVAGFQVSYETGWHKVGNFDAYIEVYCENAIVTLKYDTPFVKGLPIYVSVRQNVGPCPGGYEERVIRPTYLDAYTAQFVRFHAALRSPIIPLPGKEVCTIDGWGESSEMCGPKDAVKDLAIFEMIMSHF